MALEALQINSETILRLERDNGKNLVKVKGKVGKFLIRGSSLLPTGLIMNGSVAIGSFNLTNADVNVDVSCDLTDRFIKKFKANFVRRDTVLPLKIQTG